MQTAFRFAQNHIADPKNLTMKALIPVLLCLVLITSGTISQVVTFVALDNIDSEVETETFVEVPDALATYPGGETALAEYLIENLEYPEEARLYSIEGIVQVKFAVDRMGRISDVMIVESPDHVLSASALKAVKSMPGWNPARKDGKVVLSRVILPIKFSLLD